MLGEQHGLLGGHRVCFWASTCSLVRLAHGAPGGILGVADTTRDLLGRGKIAKRILGSADRNPCSEHNRGHTRPSSPGCNEVF